MNLEKVDYIIEYMLQSSANHNIVENIFIDDYINISMATPNDLHILLNQCNLSNIHNDVHLYRDYFKYTIEWNDAVMVSSSSDLLSYMINHEKLYIHLMNYLYTCETNSCLLRIRYQEKYVLVYIDTKKLYSLVDNDIYIQNLSYTYRNCSQYYHSNVSDGVEYQYQDYTIKLIKSSEITCRVDRLCENRYVEQKTLWYNQIHLCPQYLFYHKEFSKCIVLSELSTVMCGKLYADIANIYKTIMTNYGENMNISKYMWEITLNGESVYLTFIHNYK